jgi:methyltransferase (TIGR00027 family)
VSGRPASAQTAFGPMVIAAVERYTPPQQRLFDDELAVRFLPPAARWVVRACAWRPVRDLLVRATERSGPGMWAAFLCRKRYADDAVADALAAGIGQVVFLGAGLDTRACRLVAPAGALAFELDQRANAEDKLRRLREVYGEVPERVRVLPVDFEVDDLAAVLGGAGFDDARPAMFVWEAVSQYLTEHAVRSTFTFLAKAGTGSRLIFTYVRSDFLDGTDLYGASRLRERMAGIWKWGVAPQDVAALLRARERRAPDVGPAHTGRARHRQGQRQEPAPARLDAGEGLPRAVAVCDPAADPTPPSGADFTRNGPCVKSS